MSAANLHATAESTAAHTFARHEECVTHLSAEPAVVFDRLDDQERLANHMRKPSAMMGGGRMSYAFDEGRGRQVGSHIRMGGSAIGVTLDVDEVVTIHDPPSRKVWRTVGAVRLIVVGPYEMGFECRAEGSGTRLKVWIDYDLPVSVVGKLLGFALASLYARWCVRRMLDDALDGFAGGL